MQPTSGQLLRWWACPLGYLLFSWILFVSPDRVLQYTPRPSFLHNFTKVKDVLPLHPTSMEQAFKLGQLHNRLSLLVGTGDGSALKSQAQKTKLDDIMREVESVVGRKANSTTVTQLQNVLDEILLTQAERSVSSRVMGFFTFVNVMWMFAILGFTISIGPFLVNLVEPLRKIIVRLFNRFLWPTIVSLHENGCFELLAYATSAFCLALAQTTPDEIQAMVAVSALLLLIPSKAYSDYLWASQFEIRRQSAELSLSLASFWFALCAVPAAITAASSLLGYLCVAALYGGLGFNFVVGGMCYYIGFRDKDGLARCSVSSFLLLSLFSAARILAASHPLAAGDNVLLAPFQSAVAVLGSTMLFLALLILSSRFESWRQCDQSEKRQYWVANSWMVVCLTAAMCVGNVFGLRGMANTAVTFSVLFGMEKYAEWHRDMQFSTWGLAVLFSLVVWRWSLYLHTHPEMVVGMFHL